MLSVKLKDRRDSRQYTPNGKFAFYYGDIYKKAIQDGKEVIENQFAKILAKLELEGKREHEKRLERERYWQIQREKEQHEKERKERIENEFIEFKELLYVANQWDQARILRNFLNQVNAVQDKK